MSASTDMKTNMSTKNMSRRRKKKKGIVETWITIGIFVALFFGMIIYFGLYVKNNEQELISNNYNSRTKLLAKENTRGSIYDRNGNVIAETVINESGKEVRSYPYDALFCHAVGFSTKGRTSIESAANYYLINSNVSIAEKAENDMAGRKNPGNNVYTTYDANLQKIASDSLGMFKGAIVVSDVKTGEILAMVSKPDFDPNYVADNWDKYLANADGSSALLNRATQGIYPPGSTFKIVTALEYIRENPDTYSNYSYNCGGAYRNGDIHINCFHGSVHGTVDFKKSFAKSCNSSFANIGMSIDKDKYGKTLDELLFNTSLPLDCNYTVSNLEVDNMVSDDDMVQLSIGQGKAGITPIQLNMITNAIANDGVVMKPIMIDHIEDAHGNVIKENEASEYATLLTASEAAAMKELMTAVVNEGTGSKLQSEYYQAAGKTGSAEFGGEASDSHAWFTGFAPVDDPKVSVTIIVESVGTGGEYAVPIAKRLIDAYFGVY